MMYTGDDHATPMMLKPLQYLAPIICQSKAQKSRFNILQMVQHIKTSIPGLLCVAVLEINTTISRCSRDARSRYSALEQN
ncbi:unnamed protein product [Lathyrus oleraceus]